MKTIDYLYHEFYCLVCNSFVEVLGETYGTESGTGVRVYCGQCKNFITKIKKPKGYMVRALRGKHK